MKSSFPECSQPTKDLTSSLRRRIRPIKDTSDSGVYREQISDLDATGIARHPSLVDQRKEDSVSPKSDSDAWSQVLQNEAPSLSFGALLKAQAIFGKRDSSNHGDKRANGHGSLEKIERHCVVIDDEMLQRKAVKNESRDFLRTSKHAPTEFSSKKAISRKREVVPTRKIIPRDPRFEPSSGTVDERKTKRDYSFLDTYRESEMSELKVIIRKTKDSERKAKLKHTLLSMESRKKAEKIKDQQQEVLRKHRKEEKEMIEQGKKPFYLKKADWKQIALIERFEGMKGRQIDKVVERRRKKKVARERKEMPDTRRG